MEQDFRIGNWLVQPSLYLIKGATGETRIRPKSMSVLLCLAGATGEVVPRDRLFSEVWGDTLVSDDVLTQAIVELRRAFNEPSKAPQIIQTVPRLGYRLAQSAEDGSGHSWPGGTPHFKTLAGRFGLAAAAIVVVTAVASLITGTDTDDDSSVTRSTVAVLPFAILSDDPEDTLFADGMHESVIHRLAQSRVINVIARTSVLKYRDARSTVPEIADELNVGAVLQTSIRREDDRIIITSQLADGQTGLNLWSREYDVRLGDIFDIQSDIATRIARSLQDELSAYEESRLTLNPTVSLDAYVLYLRSLTTALPDQRLEALSQAIEIDPSFALAYVERSSAHRIRMAEALMAKSVRRFDVPWSADEEQRLALEDIDQAIELDPQLGRAYATRGMIFLLAKEYARAEREIDHARSLSPSDPVVLGYASRLKFWLREIDEARDLLGQFARLDPRNEAITAALFLTGDLDEGYDILNRAAGTDPTNPTIRHALGVYEALRNDAAAATRELELAEKLFSESEQPMNPSVLARMAYAYGRAGSTENAQRLGARVLEHPGSRYADRALAALATGQTDLSYQWLARVPNEFPELGFLNVLALKLNAIDDPALEQPRFRELRERLASSEPLLGAN